MSKRLSSLLQCKETWRFLVGVKDQPRSHPAKVIGVVIYSHQWGCLRAENTVHEYPQKPLVQRNYISGPELKKQVAGVEAHCLLRMLLLLCKLRGQ